jgi:predicted glycogen debranching enzyme
MVVLSYTLLGGERAVDLEVRPLFALRGMHELMYQWNGRLDAEEISPGHHRIPATCRLPEVFFAHDGAFHGQPCWYLNTIYWREQARGYAGLEDLWMPGVVRWTVSPGQSVHFICSTEPIELGRDVGEAERVPAVAVPKAFAGHADPGLLAVLQAALQFIVESWEGIPGIMTGYPWAVPSGRDAMICVPGLLLVTGRNEEAAGLFRAFAAAMKDGLMPSQLTPIQA